MRERGVTQADIDKSAMGMKTQQTWDTLENNTDIKTFAYQLVSLQIISMFVSTQGSLSPNRCGQLGNGERLHTCRLSKEGRGHLFLYPAATLALLETADVVETAAGVIKNTYNREKMRVKREHR